MCPAVPTSKTRFLWRVSPFDFFWAAVAPFIALALRDPSLLDDFAAGGLPHGYQYAAATIGFAIPAFLLFRLSEGMDRFFSIHDLWAVIGATFTTVAASSLTLFMVNRLEGVPRSTPLIYGLVLAAGLFGGRVIAFLLLTEQDAEPKNQRPPPIRRVILVGVDRFAAIAIKLTDCQKPRTTQFIAALDARPALLGRTINGVRIVGALADLDTVIEEYAVHGIDVGEVWVCDHSVAAEDFTRIERRCRARGVRACAISQALNLQPSRAAVFEASLAEVRSVAPNLGYFRFKRMVDAGTAFILLVLLAPVALLCAGLAYFDVGSPIIFWQRRIGQGGREFMVLKFRTYRAPFARNGAPIGSDARLSRIGKALRATRLDEIPQLFNILRGDMSLIGPRPLLPVDQPADPRLRLLVRPGVTGWAQVNGGKLVTPEEKDALDVWYIHHASIKLDCKILLRTLAIVFRGEQKENPAIQTAIGWYAKARQSNATLLGDVADAARSVSHALVQDERIAPMA
jgi:lipopolysaccharide/colanic/teichoic acid biosynthesis glycosyltransferase